MASPITEIQKDVIKLVTLVYDCNGFIPDFHARYNIRKCTEIMRRYKIQIKKQKKVKTNVSPKTKLK